MVQACEGVFKDSGLGATDGHYDILEDYTITLCPENPGEKLNIDFEEFFLEILANQKCIFMMEIAKQLIL